MSPLISISSRGYLSRIMIILALSLSILSGNAMAATTVDVLLVYETKATTWVNAHGGMATFSQDVINRMNQATLNSGIDLQFRLAYAMPVAYTTTSSPTAPLSGDLAALQAGTGAFAAVHTARNTYGADLVAMLSDTGSAYGYVGQGYILSTWAGMPTYAFTVSSIQSVAIAHTLTHEVGHNFGAHHARIQATQPGPNPNIDPAFSAAWYLNGTDGKKYHTIMAYNSIDGINWCCYPAPLFSTPLKQYMGAPTGTASDNNAQVLRETMGLIAAYRASTVTLPTPPSNLTASVVSSSQINLSWTDTSSNEDEFHIERKIGAAGVWVDIFDTGPNVTAYSNTGLAGGTTYVYRVHSKNAAGESANSNEVTATTTPAPVGTAKLINISTRANVGTGDNVMIGGFVIGGNTTHKVLILAKGPSMASGVAGTLTNPTLRLTTVSGTPVASNDDWQTNANLAEIQATGMAPTDSRESALLVTLNPNTSYTPIVEGVGGTTGVALVEVYDVDQANTGSHLINISTRARVGTGDNVMIGGFVLGGTGQRKVLIKANGPSMTGVAGTLSDPTVRLTTVSGQVIASNDNWQTNANMSEIVNTGMAPTNTKESALLLMLDANTPYTPIVEGVGGTSGVALVEVYEIQ